MTKPVVRNPNVFRVRITPEQASGLAQRQAALQDATEKDVGQQRAQIALVNYAGAVLAGHGILDAQITEVKDTKPLPTLHGIRMTPVAPAVAEKIAKRRAEKAQQVQVKRGRK